MKKKLLILGMLPLLALSSCGRGPKVTEEKAKDVATAIHEYNTKKEGEEDSQSAKEYKAFDLVMSLEGVEGEGESKKKESLKYKLQVNQDTDETRFEGYGTDGEEKIDFLIISVKPEGYENNINYLRHFNNETKEYEEFAIPSNKSNKAYDNYAIQILIAALMLARYQDPAALMDKTGSDYLFEYEDGLEDQYKETWDFYSKGEGNLTIVASSEYIGKETTFADETMVKTNYEISYDKSIIKSAKIDAKSNLGNNMKMTLNVNAKKTPIKIELPSDWEKKILPDSSIPLSSSNPTSSVIA